MKAKYEINKGDKYGKLSVLGVEKIKNKFNTTTMIHCRCECGNDITKKAHEIYRMTNLSCGCAKRSKLSINKGDIFGRLTVLDVHKGGTGRGKSKTIVNCICECGNEISVQGIKLWSVRSCGCLRHNKSGTKIWRAWQAAKRRCYEERNEKYPIYGGRGIVVCYGFHKFFHFERVLGEPPSIRHSLDRIDVNGNYSCGECKECIQKGWPKNVRWAKLIVQAQNKTSNVFFNYKGETLCLTEIARRAKLPPKTIHARIKNGWTFEEAISVPLMSRKFFKFLIEKYKDDIANKRILVDF